MDTNKNKTETQPFDVNGFKMNLAKRSLSWHTFYQTDVFVHSFMIQSITKLW